MNGTEINKKYKRPKNKTSATTNAETSKDTRNIEIEPERVEPHSPLLAKDSEWVDILQTTSDDTKTGNEEETVLQLVESEEGPETKPLVLMFPGLLNEDPETVEGMLNKAMSTSEVTKHLVGQKANFAFMKKVNRLIPSDKKWLESLTENSASLCSIASGLQSDSLQSDYEADTEETDNEQDNENKVEIIRLSTSKH